MGYDTRNPIFSFRLGEYRHGKIHRLAKLHKMPVNDFVRKILDNYLDGDLIEKPKDDLAVEMTKLRIEKLKQENKYMNLKIKFFENFGRHLSESGLRITKPQIITTEPQKTTWISSHNPEPKKEDPPMSPYDEKNNRLECLECHQKFLWAHPTEFNTQIVEFQRHITNNHGRELTHIERTAILKVNYEGASK